jgi:UDP-2,3-diacylglucosamine pyrophosphatase LpxH
MIDYQDPAALFAGFIGLLCGLALAIIFSTAWIGLAGAAQEWLTERFLDRAVSDAGPIDQEEREGQQEVLVSDLHIDTWDYPHGKPGARATAFLEFLTAVQQAPNVRGFILNGDLMDIPLFPGNLTPEQKLLLLPVMDEIQMTEQGVLATRYDEVLQPLLTLEAIVAQALEKPGLRRTIFQTGNHDIGINGLRYVRRDMPRFLPTVQIAWNPQLLLLSGPETGSSYKHPVYIEHGHHYDPFLWLYMRYALLDVLRGGVQRREAQLMAAMQRGGRKGMGRPSRQGIPTEEAVAAAHAAGKPLITEVRAEPAAAGSATEEWHFAAESRTRSFGEKVVQYRFRQAARRVFRDLHRRHRRNIRTVMFGHTHLPDRYVFPGGRVYINSGDWCGNTPHQCYCVIQADGTVRGPFQWDSAHTAEFGRQPPLGGGQ